MISNEQYAALSEFRYRLGEFLRYSETISRQTGISAAQYQLMLHIRATGARGSATIGELAERLGTSHQAAVALVKRCEARQLVTKHRRADDERKIEVRLTSAARRVLAKLAEWHLQALAGIHDVIRIAHLTDRPAAKQHKATKGSGRSRRSP